MSSSANLQNVNFLIRRQPPHPQQGNYVQGPPPGIQGPPGPPGPQGPPGFSTFDKGVEGPKGRGQRGRRY